MHFCRIPINATQRLVNVPFNQIKFEMEGLTGAVRDQLLRERAEHNAFTTRINDSLTASLAAFHMIVDKTPVTRRRDLVCEAFDYSR